MALGMDCLAGKEKAEQEQPRVCQRILVLKSTPPS